MRARSLLAKSAIVLWSLVLVSGYVYQRSGGAWFFASPSERKPPATARELMPGPKAGKVQWDRWYAELQPHEREAFQEEMRKELRKEKERARH
jgi:hypothetical protein